MVLDTAGVAVWVGDLVHVHGNVDLGRAHKIFSFYTSNGIVMVEAWRAIILPPSSASIAHVLFECDHNEEHVRSFPN